MQVWCPFRICSWRGALFSRFGPKVLTQTGPQTLVASKDPTVCRPVLTPLCSARVCTRANVLTSISKHGNWSEHEIKRTPHTLIFYAPDFHIWCRLNSSLYTVLDTALEFSLLNTQSHIVAVHIGIGGLNAAALPQLKSTVWGAFTHGG